MKNKKTKTSALFFLGLGLATVNAQEASLASGSNVSGSGGSVSYSIGQVVYTTHTSTTGIVAQGVQQPYEISVVTSISEASNINLTALVYPNPTTDGLTLSVSDFNKENLIYQVVDINGKLLQSEKIASNQMSISLTNLAAATYFLKVSMNNQEIKTFKIIKN